MNIYAYTKLMHTIQLAYVKEANYFFNRNRYIGGGTERAGVQNTNLTSILPFEAS